MPNQQNMDVNNLVDDDGDPLAGDALVKRLRKLYNEAAKRAGELEGELSGYRTKERQSSLAETLAKHGIPAKAAKWIPEDADLTEWIKENAEMFGGSVDPVKADETPDETPPAAGSAADPEAQRLAALKALASTPETGLTFTPPEGVKNDPAAYRKWLKETVTAIQQ